MPSNNQRNNELEFTPTFGTQQSKHNYRDFIYVECAPDKPSWAYKLSQEDIDRDVKEFGYCQEEYGLFRNRIITRREYDEGSTLIHGKPTITSGAKLRSRVLTKYNFIIAANIPLPTQTPLINIQKSTLINC